ncbi:GFA family protein [Aestuariibius insulae]|uniref:GFA family protein n=1 Tax=Aestuariibius insulae TaxID=2058287 RepID=UPI00345E1599
MKVTCHCGAVELQVSVDLERARPRRCNCSFCKRRAAATVSVHESDLRIVTGADVLTLYQWNTGVAEHYFCSICGIYTHHRRRSDPTEFGVNLGALEGVQPRDYEPVSWVDGSSYK